MTIHALHQSLLLLLKLWTHIWWNISKGRSALTSQTKF
uniref:Uncharacterized protein n=1 Tax=Rhizophora mucronata TaxID=61149 RepID=A0A2P2N144_RHIMU